MSQDHIDSIQKLLNATVDEVEKHKLNFKNVESAFKEINGKLNAVTMINNILMSCLAAASPQFKSDLQVSLETILFAGHELPGDFEQQALKIIEHVCRADGTEPPEQQPKAIFRVLQGGLADQDSKEPPT